MLHLSSIVYTVNFTVYTIDDRRRELYYTANFRNTDSGPTGIACSKFLGLINTDDRRVFTRLKNLTSFK